MKLQDKKTFEASLADLDNAVIYRTRRIHDGSESILDEIISDIPHVRDFTSSVMETCTHLYTMNMAGALNGAPKLLLSAIGVGAAIPNIWTINKERLEHKSELRSTLRLRKDLLKTRDPATLEKKERLELEGVSDTGVGTLVKSELQNAERLAFMPPLKRIQDQIKHADAAFYKNSLVSGVHFIKKTVSDSLLNFIRHNSRQGIIQGAIKGSKNTLKCKFIEKADIKRLANVKTMSEKITKAQSEEKDSVVISGRYLKLSKINADDIKKIDGIREATREKAQQLQTATTGFGLQAAFISASIGLCILHTRNQDYAEAALQFASANLASNPLRFVGEQTQELYEAINSHRVEESDAIARLYESHAHLPHDEPEAPKGLSPQ